MGVPADPPANCIARNYRSQMSQRSGRPNQGANGGRPYGHPAVTVLPVHTSLPQVGRMFPRTISPHKTDYGRTRTLAPGKAFSVNPLESCDDIISLLPRLGPGF